MKKILSIALFCFLQHIVFAQIQNPSFELWDTGDPIWWSTSNFYAPGSAIQSNDAHGGMFALNMSVVADSLGVPNAPYAINYFPLTTMPQVLTFWVKGNLAGNNKINASFYLNELDSNINTLAYGDQGFTSINNVYQYKFLNIIPLAGPSLLGQASVYFDITEDVGNSLNINTTVTIDDIYVGPDNTSIRETSNRKEVIEKVYPSPVQEQAFLVFNQSKYGKVSLKLYDLLGNLVQEIINENMPEGKYKAEINASTLVQGIYLCKLTIDEVEYCAKLIKG